MDRDQDEIDRLAAERDHRADQRDRAAIGRDLDEAIADKLMEDEPGEDDRRRAAKHRYKASEDRRASAGDRRGAAEDRAQAKALRDGDGQLGEVIDLAERRDSGDSSVAG
jgi:hypothetical protein